MCTTQTNKEARCKCSQHNQINHFICSTFLYLVVLWVFAARVLPNWWSCFLNLQVFFYLQHVELSRPHKKKKIVNSDNTMYTCCIVNMLLFWCLVDYITMVNFCKDFLSKCQHARTHAHTHTHTHTHTHLSVQPACVLLNEWLCCCSDGIMRLSY